MPIGFPARRAMNTSAPRRITGPGKVDEREETRPKSGKSDAGLHVRARLAQLLKPR